MEELKHAIEELRQVKDKILDIKADVENETIYNGDDVNKNLSEAIYYLDGITEGIDYACEQLGEAAALIEIIEDEKRVWA